jgi:hypothetical protein
MSGCLSVSEIGWAWATLSFVDRSRGGGGCSVSGCGIYTIEYRFLNFICRLGCGCTVLLNRGGGHVGITHHWMTESGWCKANRGGQAGGGEGGGRYLALESIEEQAGGVSPHGAFVVETLRPLYEVPALYRVMLHWETEAESHHHLLRRFHVSADIGSPTSTDRLL